MAALIPNLMDKPVHVQSPFGDQDSKLWIVQCVGRNDIFTSGDTETIQKINWTKRILQTILTADNVLAMAINSQQNPICSLSNGSHSNIYIYNGAQENVLFNITGWSPVGLCYTVMEHLLVSMRSIDGTQSRVVRYSGAPFTQAAPEIQYDSQLQPLFSTGVSKVLFLTENGNGDICVADYAGKAVVVVDSTGQFRFKYTGNNYADKGFQNFQPLHIATDIREQILIGDISSNTIHIIKNDGTFLRFLQYAVTPCDGGMSIDSDSNLLVGESSTGKIQIFKYLE